MKIMDYRREVLGQKLKKYNPQSGDVKLSEQPENSNRTPQKASKVHPWRDKRVPIML